MMNIKIKCSLVLFLLLACHHAVAQMRTPCGFDSWFALQKKAGFNADSVEAIIQFKALQKSKKHRVSNTDSGVYLIPVVVHVVHLGGSENISKVQIQSQIDVLNEDFRRKAGTNGFGTGVDTRIQFCLAKRNPQGKCTDGIVRIKSPLSNHQSYQRGDLARLSSWDATRYLNLYVVKSMAGGVLGYASFPGSPPDQDGSVMRHTAFGRIGTATTPNNLGRTASHELGHWFGLYHTFQDGCGTDTCLNGDKVCDTPPVAAPNFNCNALLNSCQNDFPDLNDQIKNYMDYTSDGCKSMFTTGQARRLQASLEVIRNVIWQDSNLVFTGCDTAYNPPPTCLPVAGFIALKREICTGGSINFMSRSLNSPSSYRWTFSGGTPANSTLENPTVVYPFAGTFSVSLKISNVNGVDSVALTNYVNVAAAVAGSGNAWGDNFENPSFPANGIAIDNPDDGLTWERTTDAADEGTASVRIQNLININYGQADALLLPRFDFTTFQSPIRMAFRWAYARSDPSYSDELIVLVSKDCGSTWVQKFYRTGTSLATAPTQTSLFVPTLTQWKLANIDLSTYAAENHVDIRIVNVTDGGNALYLDSVSVGPFDFTTLGIDALMDPLVQLQVYPNPATHQLTVQFQAIDLVGSISIFDALGKEWLQFEALETNYLNIKLLPKGIYCIKVSSGKRTHQKSFIKE